MSDMLHAACENATDTITHFLYAIIGKAGVSYMSAGDLCQIVTFENSN